MTSVTVLKDCIISKDISKWNEIILKNYIETRVNRKDTAKRLSFLEYWKLVNQGQSNHDFFLLKTHQKKHVESKMCIKMTSIILPSKLEKNIRTKMFLWSTQNQRCFNFKFRRWFNVDNLTLFGRRNTLSFLRCMKILIFQASCYQKKFAF